MDEEALQVAHKLALSQGYDGDINKFKSLLSTNEEALNTSYKLAISEGYDGDINKYKNLLGVGVKKKEDTVSPSKGGTSVLPKTKADAIAESKSLGTPTGEYTYAPEAFDKEVPLAPQSRANKPIVPKPIFKPKEEFFYYEPDIYSEEVLAPKSRANKPKVEVESKPTISNDEFNKRIATITPELTSKEEEFTVPQLNYQFKDFGFTFEETGLGDAVSVTAPNGKKTTISLGKTADRDLQKFLKDNANQYDKLSKSISNQENYNRTFADQKEIESSFVKIQQEQNDFTQSVQELYKIPKDTEEYKVKLAELQKKQTQIEGSKKDLNKSVGKYVAMKSTQGETSEYLYNQLLEGLTSAASGTAGLMIDAFAPSNMTDAEKKAAKKWLQPILRESLDFAKSESTTKEYAANVGFIEGAVGGLVKSLPAMLAAEGMPLVMAAQISDDLDVQMDSDPNFKNISENEKLLLKTPLMIGGAVLESYGLRNAVGTKGLLNDLVASAIGKSTKSTTTKTFKEFIEQDIESRIAKGALKIGAGGLAEFETGASQELLDITTKDIYNAAKDKDMFQTPNTFGEGAKQVIKAGLQEAIGGFILSTPSAVSSAYKNNDYKDVTEGQIEVLKNLGNDVNVMTAIEADLQSKVNLGDLTPKEAEEQLNDTREVVGTLNSTDTEGLTNEQIKEKLPLVTELNKEEKKKKSLNPADKEVLNEKINALKEKIKSIQPKKQEDAIQEPTTEKSVLRNEQPEMGLQGVGEGNTKKQAVTEQGKAKEEVKPIKNKKDENENGIKTGGTQGNENVPSEVQGNGEKGGQQINVTESTTEEKVLKEEPKSAVEQTAAEGVKPIDKNRALLNAEKIDKGNGGHVQNMSMQELDELANDIIANESEYKNKFDDAQGIYNLVTEKIDEINTSQLQVQKPIVVETAAEEVSSKGVGDDFGTPELKEIGVEIKKDLTSEGFYQVYKNGKFVGLLGATSFQQARNKGQHFDEALMSDILSRMGIEHSKAERNIQGENEFLTIRIKNVKSVEQYLSAEQPIEASTKPIVAEIEDYTKAKEERKKDVLKNYQFDLKTEFINKNKLPKETIDDANFNKAWNSGILNNANNIGLEEIAPNLIQNAIQNPKPFIDAYNRINKKYGTKNGFIKDTESAKKDFIKLINLAINETDNNKQNDSNDKANILGNKKETGTGGKIESNAESTKKPISIIAETKTTASTDILQVKKIKGKLFNQKQSEEIQKEIESNYTPEGKIAFSGQYKDDNGETKRSDDIRVKMYNYDNPIASRTVNGKDIRITEGLIRNGKKTYLLYSDSKIVGEFESVDDAKKTVKLIQDNLVKPIELPKSETKESASKETPKVKSIEAIELEKQIVVAQNEVTSLNDKIKTKSAEMGKTYMEDQSNLFGERKSEENVLFSQRVNPDQINKVLGDLKAKRDAAIKNVRSLKEKLAKVEKEGSIQQDMFGYNPQPKKKPTILDNTKKKYGKLDELSPRTLLLRFFATGGKVSSEEGMKRTKLGMKDLWGKVAKKGSTYHQLYESITDELGMELGDIDQLDFDNMVDEFLRGNKSDIFKEINQHIGEKEKSQEDTYNYTYEELQQQLKDIDPYYHDWIIEQIGEQERLIQDELTPKEAEELDRTIEKYTVDGIVDWDAIENDKNVQQLELNTNGKQDTKTESTIKRDSTPISEKEKTGQRSEKITPETLIKDDTLPKKFRYTVKSWATVSRKMGYEPYIKDGKMIFKVATGDIYEMPLNEGKNIEQWKEDYNSYIDGLKVGDTIKYKYYGSENTEKVRKVNKNKEGKVSSISTENHNISPDNLRSEIYSPQGMLGRDIRDVGMSWYSGLDKYKQPIYEKLLKLSESGSSNAVNQEGDKETISQKEVTDAGKMFSASSRFKPAEMVVFEKPIVGKNGNKLVSYQWSYEWTMKPNHEGELKDKRVSDWSQAESSAETGRDLVHKFVVERKDGTVVTVSSESVPELLGYVDSKEMNNLPSIVSAVKTLAKQRMQLAVLKAQEAEYNELVNKYKNSPKPEIKEIAEPIKFTGVQEQYKEGHHNVYSMGDSWVRQDNPYDYSTKSYKKVDRITKSTEQDLISTWINNQVKKEGGKAPQGIYDLERRIERQEKKVGVITKELTPEQQVQKGIDQLKDIVTGKGGVLRDITSIPAEILEALGNIAIGYAKMGVNGLKDFIKAIREDEVLSKYFKVATDKELEEVFKNANSVEEVKETVKEEAEPKKVKKTVSTIRAYEGQIREGVKKELEKLGLTRTVQNLAEAKKQAKAFVESVGEEHALEAVRNNDVRDAEAAYVFNELIEGVGKKLMFETDAEEISRLERLQASLFDELNREAESRGRFGPALDDIYQNSEIVNYNAEKRIKEYKEANNGEMSSELEAKFRKLGEEFKEVQKKYIEAEERAKKAEDEATIKIIQEAAEREKKQRVSNKIRKDTDWIVLKVKEAKIHRPNMFSSATPASLVWDGAVETVATTLKLTGRSIEAIAKGVEFIRNSDWYNNLNREDKKTALKQFNDFWKGVQPRVENGKIKIPDSLIQDLVEAGADTIDKLVKQVKDIMIENYPDVTDRQIRDAITEYGKIKNLNQDEIRAEIRKIKRIGRIISALEDVNEKKRPLRSGIQRDKLDADERALNKELREAMKELPIDEELEAEQQKNATDAAKTRIQNQIEDLQREIDRGELVPRKIRTVKDDAELTALKAERDALKAEHEAIFKDEEFKQAKRLELTKRNTQKRIEDLQRRIKEGDFSKKVRTPLIKDTELLKLRAEKLRIQDEYDKELYKVQLKNRTKFQKTIDSLWELWGIPRILMATGEASFILIQGAKLGISHPLHAAKAFKNSWASFKSEKKTEQFLRDIKSQDYYPVMKDSKLALTEPKAELLAREELFYSGWTNMIWDNLGKIILSPTRFKDKATFDRAAEIWSDLNPFKAIERASIGYLDTIRVLRFLDGMNILETQGKTFETNPQDYKDIANAINTMTGRASLGKAEQFAATLSKVFFSPRNWASGIKTATPYALYHFGKMTPTARKMAISDFSKYVGLTTTMVMLAAAYLNDDDDEETSVELDPRSSDFMKIKLGDTRVDPWGGMQQQIVLSSRLIAEGLYRALPEGQIQGAYKKKGEVVPLGLERQTPTALKLMGQQAVNKLNPTASVVFNYLSAKRDKDGMLVDEYYNPLTLKEELQDKFNPIFWTTVGELLKEDPTALDGLLTFYAFVGGGVNVYEKQKPKNNTPKKRTQRKRIQENN